MKTIVTISGIVLCYFAFGLGGTSLPQPAKVISAPVKLATTFDQLKPCVDPTGLASPSTKYCPNYDKLRTEARDKSFARELEVAEHAHKVALITHNRMLVECEAGEARSCNTSEYTLTALNEAETRLVQAISDNSKGSWNTCPKDGTPCD